MKKYFHFLFILSTIFFACNSGSVKTEQESYQHIKENLLEKEQKDPAAFLLVSGTNRQNLLGQTVIKGIITNKATLAVFKDVDLKLTFYSKTKALLETDKETIFEKFNPGEAKDFKTKYFAPKGTDSVGLEVLSAKVVEVAIPQP